MIRHSVSRASGSAARHCARPLCSEPSCATLTYEYRAQTVWIDLLAVDREPSAYDLCGRHADRVRVPRGWQLVDRRPATDSPLAALTRAG